MTSYVIGFHEIDGSKLMIVGGKGLNLGELSKIEGLKVPEGFCVTTEAYKKITENNAQFSLLLKELGNLKIDDTDKIEEISRAMRQIIENAEISKDIEEEITAYISKLGAEFSYAVRSSATAEDLPLASFAGQQDTYLNIIGIGEIIKAVKKCWASLFTSRAVIYRIQNGFDHEKVYLSVVIQKMIFPEASGIMFTADPVTSNRKVLSIDASFGLGEALVSGIVNADVYKVRDGKITDKKISSKKLAVYPMKEGGTKEQEIKSDMQNLQTLTDEQILRLEGLGRKIEAYFGSPQDIEWCLLEDEIYIVQSRAITTLYPIPISEDDKLRVYISLGHQQMMTKEIKPLGISFFHLLSFWFSGIGKPAGGRLYIDVTYDLASSIGRKVLLDSTGKVDVLMKNALLNLEKRKGFIKSLPKGKGSINMSSGTVSWIRQGIKIYRNNDIKFIEELIERNKALISDMEKRIENVTGDELFEFIIQDTKELSKTLYDPQSMGVMVVWGYVSGWINKNMEKWLGEKNAVDILSKSAPNNITSSMGLDLMDVSETVRKYPQVMKYLKNASDRTFFEDIEELGGGDSVSNSIREYLRKYGMRGVGEIDITNPRWNENPASLAPLILNNIRNAEIHTGESMLDEGRIEAMNKQDELLSRLEKLPGGRAKAKKTKKMISVLRNVTGYREYPKYFIVSRYQIYKNALMKEAEILAERGIIKEKEDIYYLFLEELREAISTNELDYDVIRKRKEEYEVYEKLTPPRVITSEGEIISGAYETGSIPAGALVGLAVSSGIIEGRARVILKLEDADIQEGDILVTAFTDPSWTALFVSLRGLVTEVGGLMTHGAVITREYDIPGVVGVENATKLIKDGQMIRVNGTEGYVEILE